MTPEDVGSPTPRSERLVQCGWCPMILAADSVTIAFHFTDVHRINGFSVRPIKGTDWSMDEINEGADRG